MNGLTTSLLDDESSEGSEETEEQEVFTYGRVLARRLSKVRLNCILYLCVEYHDYICVKSNLKKFCSIQFMFMVEVPLVLSKT